MFLFILNLSVGILILILSSKYIECRIPYEYKGETFTKYSIVKVTPEQCKGQKNLKELNGNINFKAYISHDALLPKALSVLKGDLRDILNELKNQNKKALTD